MTKKYAFLLFLAAVALMAGCSRIKDDVIPAMPVGIDLTNIGIWSVYGVNGYGDYRYFNIETGEPKGFPFTATTFTGYGGVVIVCGYDFTTGDYNSILAYDMACPVERRKDVKISINKEFKAVCKACGSTFDVCEGGGAPTSGKALDQKVGLSRYTASKSGGGYFIRR